MSLRVLVVEDNEEIYQYFMRIFENILEIEKFEFVHVTTVQGAIEILGGQWDVILMDYTLGESAEVDGAIFRNGVDLINYRRVLENFSKDTPDPLAQALIMGTSSNTVSNDMMHAVGAEASYLKLQVPEMAGCLTEVLKLKESTAIHG